MKNMAAVITCEDFRLHQRQDGRNYTAEFCKATKRDCDLITRAGAVHDLVSPQSTGLNFDQSLIRDVGVSARLHEAGQVYLISHENCLAYRYLKLSSRDQERERIKQDLRTAKIILERKFPGIEAKIYFAELATGTKDVFDIKEIF